MPVPLTLKVYKGDQLIATKEYDRDIIKIGRLASAHLCLDDEKVSRIHSVIEVSSQGALSIIDMGSVEGTYVNGKRVNKGAIAGGDEIKVGSTMIKVALTPVARNLAAAATGNLSESATAPPTGSPAKALSQAMRDESIPSGPVELPPPPPAESTEAGMDTVARAAGAAVSRVRPEQRKGSGPLGLELRFKWGDRMVGEYFLPPKLKKSFTVGTGPGVDFIMGDDRLSGPKFDVVQSDGQSFVLRFNAKMKGELHRDGAVISLKEAIETQKAQHEGDAYALHLEANDFAWVDLGAIDLEVCFRPVPKPAFLPFIERIDFTVLNIFLLMFLFSALFVITALNRVVEGEGYVDELSSNQARIAKLIIKSPEIQKNRFLEKLAKSKENQGEMAAKHKDEEGQMGKKDAPKRNTRTAPKGDPNNKDQARMMTQRIFGPNGGGISTIFGHNGLGGELKSAMGNMFGAAPGDSRGLGGLGLRGSGSGGGGVGNSIGIGGIGTKGRGGGVGSYGVGAGYLGGKKDTVPEVTASEPMVMGSLDKELIRQVIHRNRNQIRYCYESQLTRHPKLSGKVAIKFVITASGTVASSQVSQTSLNNTELETCIASRVQTWIFPKPKGGGVVIVTYPFILKQSG
ncbi:MAG TPA: adventurous gliding motility protein GltG, partial [Myxococcaceae bacterium]|nr:adventurous gliding motility protein GltG [Myxococcaceae bacterium]